MGFASPAGKIDAEAIIVTFDGEGVGFALEMTVLGEDQAIGVPEVGAESDVAGVRKLRIQAAGRFGVTIPQRPAADFLGNTINSPPQPTSRSFCPPPLRVPSSSPRYGSRPPVFRWPASPPLQGSAPARSPVSPAPPGDDPARHRSCGIAGTASVAARGGYSRFLPPLRFRNVDIASPHFNQVSNQNQYLLSNPEKRSAASWKDESRT